MSYEQKGEAKAHSSAIAWPWTCTVYSLPFYFQLRDMSSRIWKMQWISCWKAEKMLINMVLPGSSLTSKYTSILPVDTIARLPNLSPVPAPTLLYVLLPGIQPLSTLFMPRSNPCTGLCCILSMAQGGWHSCLHWPKSPGSDPEVPYGILNTLGLYKSFLLAQKSA